MMAKSKARYVDGFVMVIPKKNASAYETMATEASKVWKKHGALEPMPFDPERLSYAGFKVVVDI
jgi:uncharacterized protein YbaA (DUF1428 family)